MGGAVSAGVDNDELIDNLLEADYIKSAAVERVFRAVDRGHYFTQEFKDSAYKDLAWKWGNLHISAPCIYSEVMENLKLGPGMSFLNLGSGTGYLNTMAGLMLGSNGINHGIEIHEDVLNYAVKRLDEFCLASPAVDEYEFCHPKFINGNCLFLGSDVRQYDRVYCGAACPENHENYMKNLIKVGGILVMPINDQLLQIYRTSDTNWEAKSVLPVSFATLVCNKISGGTEPLKMPDADPLSLQDICRFAVRAILRRNINIEHPELKRRPPRVPRKRVKKRTLRHLVIPIFGSHSDREDEVDSDEHQGRRDYGRGGFIMDLHNGPSCKTVIEFNQLIEGPRSETHTESQTMETEEDAGTSGPRVESPEVDEGMSEDEDLEKPAEEDETSTSAIKQKNKVKVTKREKFDSGIVEDMENGKGISSDSDLEDDDDDDEDDDYAEYVEYFDTAGFGLRQCHVVPQLDSDTDTDTCDNVAEKAEIKIPAAIPSPAAEASGQTVNYCTYMKEKIKMLPLPITLKYFLNLDREL